MKYFTVYKLLSREKLKFLTSQKKFSVNKSSANPKPSQSNPSPSTNLSQQSQHQTIPQRKPLQSTTNIFNLTLFGYHKFLSPEGRKTYRTHSTTVIIGTLSSPPPSKHFNFSLSTYVHRLKFPENKILFDTRGAREEKFTNTKLCSFSPHIVCVKTIFLFIAPSMFTGSTKAIFDAIG